MNRTGSYRDYVPNRFRDFTPPPVRTASPGDIVITSTGVFEAGPDGALHPRPATPR